MSPHKATRIQIEKIYDRIADNVAYNLAGMTFGFSRFIYKLISSTLRDTIIQEIKGVLNSLVLTSTQQKVLDDILASPQTANEFINSIAGNLQYNFSYGPITGDGVQATGLIKTYFDSLQSDLKELVGNYLLGYSQLNSTVQKMSESGVGQFHIYASKDELKGNQVERNKSIITAFCNAIVTFANADQLGQLCTEIKTSDNDAINKLRIPEGIAGFFSKEMNTNSYNRHINYLFNQSNTGKLVSRFLFGKINTYEDTGKFIGSFFNTKDKMTLVNALPLVSKELHEFSEKENENSNVNFGRK